MIIIEYIADMMSRSGRSILYINDSELINENFKYIIHSNIEILFLRLISIIYINIMNLFRRVIDIISRIFLIF